MCGSSGEAGDEADKGSLVGTFCGMYMDVW